MLVTINKNADYYLRTLAEDELYKCQVEISERQERIIQKWRNYKTLGLFKLNKYRIFSEEKLSISDRYKYNCYYLQQKEKNLLRFLKVLDHLDYFNEIYVEDEFLKDLGL